jgi:hypothetical protein
MDSGACQCHSRPPTNRSQAAYFHSNSSARHVRFDHNERGGYVSERPKNSRPKTISAQPTANPRMVTSSLTGRTVCDRGGALVALTFPPVGLDRQGDHTWRSHRPCYYRRFWTFGETSALLPRQSPLSPSSAGPVNDPDTTKRQGDGRDLVAGIGRKGPSVEPRHRSQVRCREARTASRHQYPWVSSDLFPEMRGLIGARAVQRSHRVTSPRVVLFLLVLGSVF